MWPAPFPFFVLEGCLGSEGSGRSLSARRLCLQFQGLPPEGVSWCVVKTCMSGVDSLICSHLLSRRPFPALQQPSESLARAGCFSPDQKKKKTLPPPARPFPARSLESVNPTNALASQSPHPL